MKYFILSKSSLTQLIIENMLRYLKVCVIDTLRAVCTKTPNYSHCIIKL